MRKLTIRQALLASVGVSILAISPVTAADIVPSRPYPMPKAPVFVPFFSWNGFYLGLNAGYGFGTSNWTSTVTGVTTGDFDINGPVVGGTIGYNWQFSSAVFGLEGDIAWSNIKGSAPCVGLLTCETSNSWLGTARARIGYAFDRFLPYVTAGAAFGEIKGKASITGTPVFVDVISKTQTGWTAGGGLEYAFLHNWTAKIEYLYVDLGSVECPAANCLTTVDIDFRTHLVRGGVNYKF